MSFSCFYQLVSLWGELLLKYTRTPAGNDQVCCLITVQGHCDERRAASGVFPQHFLFFYGLYQYQAKLGEFLLI